MANLGTVGTSLTSFGAGKSQPNYTNRRAGDSFTGANRGAAGTSFTLFGAIRSIPSYTSRLAGSGGTKGVSSDGGGGSARTTRTFGSVG